jgi:hypothetical protein
MSAENNQNSLLSSWKEIANYLNCSVRTCIRWEKEYDLPVHRIEGKQKSSVFAYKKELNKWLEKKFDSNSNLKKSKNRLYMWRISLFILLPIIAAILIYFFILKAPGTPKRPGMPNKPIPSGIPQSTGPLTLRDNDIVTTGFPRSTRVWRKGKNNLYKEVWKIEPVRHSSIVVGNVDNEKDCEIVGPGFCRVTEKRGERQVSFYKYWINVYKQGEENWWKTTYYSDSDCVFEEKSFELSEIAIADVDGNPGNEIILITKHCLAIFQYDLEIEEFKLLSSRYTFFDDNPLFLKSIVTRNIDNDDAEEILITADEMDESGTAISKGCLGDIIEGGHPEIVAPAYRLNGDTWNTFIMGWDIEGEKIFEKALYDRGDYEWRLIHLDVGNLTAKRGEEIIVGHHVPDELIYYYWNGTKLMEGSRFALDHRYVAISNVYIVDSDDNPDSLGEVIVCGRGFEVGGTGQFYLEVLGFNQGLFSKWFRLGGERGEIRVSYAAIAKRNEKKK